MVLKVKIEGKLVTVQWAEMARVTADILSHFPTRPHMAGLLDARPGQLSPPPASLDGPRENLKGVVSLIEAHLTRDAVKPDTPQWLSSVKALGGLKFVIDSAWVPGDLKKKLPITIAEIEPTASAANALKAKAPRPNVDRRGALTIAIEEAVRQSTDDSTISIYYALKNGDKVERREGGKVYYYVGDALRDMTWGRFGVIVSNARKAKAKGLRSRKSKNSMG